MKATSPVQDLHGQDAIAQLLDIAGHARTCMFLTKLGSIPFASRPMAIQAVEENGSFYFISSKQSDKNADIQADNNVALTIQDDGKSHYLTVFGTATIIDDKALIEKYWTEFANAWFEGKDDPEISIIEVKPTTGQYWSTKDGKFVALAKMAYSAVTHAHTDDGGIEGTIRL